MHAPVVMVGYTRTGTLSRSLANLSKCHGVGNRDVFVFIDAASCADDEAKVNAMVALAETFSNEIRNLKVIARRRNLGVPGNMVQAIGEVINRYGRVIFFEDDVLVSRTFLLFMDMALDKYEDDSRIFCINGWKEPLVWLPRCYREDVFLSPVLSAWGFGTWKNRWDSVDFNVEDWPEFRRDENRVRNYYRQLGPVGISLLDGIVAGTVHTWDAQCCYRMFRNNLFAVAPRYSLTKNIGFGMESIHSSWRDWNVITQRYYNYVPSLPEALEPNRKILRKFGYHSRVEWYLRGIGRIIRRNIVKWGPQHDEPAEVC